MLKDLIVFKAAYAMATHAGKRQAVIAQNVANADTPGYRARDISAFQAAFGTDETLSAMRSGRAGHLHGQNRTTPVWREVVSDGETDPNSNSVSIELEMLKAVEARRQHDRALAIYKSSLNILRTSLGRS